MQHDRDAKQESRTRSGSDSPAIRGVLLDVDGTLVDSNDAHARAWVEAFADAHIEVRFENVRTLIGKGGDKLMPEVAGIDAESELGRQISETRRRIFCERYLPNVRAFPGARELVRRMKDSGLKLAVASSAAKEELEGLLKVAGVRDLLDHVTSSDDVDRSKPDPDVVCAALDAIALPREQVLMIGDTPYDVEAATRAGIGIIAFRCGGWTDDALAGALAIYDGPADLLAHYDEFPLGSGRVERRASTPADTRARGSEYSARDSRGR